MLSSCGGVQEWVFFMQQTWQFLQFRDELHKLPAPAFTSPRIWEKPALGMLRHTVAASPGGITASPARWVHSPHSGLCLTQRAPLSASFLSITFGKFILFLINNHAPVGHKCSSCPCSCLSLSSSSSVVAVKCLVLPCPHSGGFVLVITGSKLPLLLLLFEQCLFIGE